MCFYFKNIDVEMAKKFDPSAHELVDIGIDSILRICDIGDKAHQSSPTQIASISEA